MADFYVVKEGGKCSVVETAGDAKPTTGKVWGEISHPSRREEGHGREPALQAAAVVANSSGNHQLVGGADAWRSEKAVEG
jgi:hypothetical protein